MTDGITDILNMGESATPPVVPKVDDIFGGTEEPPAMAAITTLAEFICNEEDALAAIKSDHTKRKDANDMAKEQLYDLIKGAGMDSVKLSCGLAPGTKLTDKFYKAAGCTDEEQQAWLVENNLGDIIKPTVHFGTFNSTMKTFVGQGGVTPEIFNQVPVKGITMRGKSKYLAAKDGVFGKKS